MHTVKMRNLEIGAGRPKLMVPIVGATADQILQSGREIAGRRPDAVEWRVDYYEDSPDIGCTLETAAALRRELGKLPVLFTFRTADAGGEKPVSPEAYTALNRAAAESGYVDAVDVEMLRDENCAEENLIHIHQAGLPVIGSDHEFSRTPSAAEMVRRLRKMQEMGADMLKLAVMPRSKGDVLALLSATEEMVRCYADRPVITVSMSPAGLISRLCGEVFGSAVTFGSVGQTSAPGQIDVEELAQVLEVIHRHVI